MTGHALPPTSAFAGDDGGPDPDLAATLQRFAAGTVGLPDAVAALAGTRLLVPVVATGDETDGPHRHVETAVAAVAAPDGRTALPVFTSVAALRVWRRDARPVPVEAARAAAAAVQEGWELLVVDPAGPVTVVVPRPAVRCLAAGTPWQPAVTGGAVRSRVRDAVVQAVADLAGVVSADAVPGGRAEVAVVLAVAPGLDRAGLDRLMAQAGARLGAAALVVADVDSIELRVEVSGGAAAAAAPPRAR